MSTDNVTEGSQKQAAGELSQENVAEKNGTFYAFCSLIMPGLGQLLQKRIEAAIGFFILFILSGFLPVLIVSLLFRDRFAYETLQTHLLHMFLFGVLFWLFVSVIVWSAVDAVKKQEEETTKKNGGCGCVEFLVAIAILGMLVALLFPAVPLSREAARRMTCSNNIKQILYAFHNYHVAHNHFPPAYSIDESGKPLHSWRVLILPYIEQKDLYEKIRLDEPWDSEYNRQFHSQAPSIFLCPSSNIREVERVPAPSASYYSVIDGAEAAFFGSQTRSKSDVKKPDETIFLVERRIPVNWMDPSREMTFETASKGANVDAMGISSYHSGSALAGFGDGRVQTISKSVNSETLRKLLTLNAEDKPGL